MDNLDTVNRSLQGPIHPEDAPPILGAEEAIQSGQAPSVVAPRTARSAPTAPVTVSSTSPAVVPPTTSVAADVALASQMYISALTNHEKAAARVAKAKEELAAAIAEEGTAAKRRDTLQQELLRYLAPAKK